MLGHLHWATGLHSSGCMKCKLVSLTDAAKKQNSGAWCTVCILTKHRYIRQQEKIKELDDGLDGSFSMRSAMKESPPAGAGHIAHSELKNYRQNYFMESDAAKIGPLVQIEKTIVGELLNIYAHYKLGSVVFKTMCF